MVIFVLYTVYVIINFCNFVITTGPITSDHIEDTGLIIPNSQHVFKPIISPRPSILRKRDADGLENLIYNFVSFKYCSNNDLL